MVVSPNKLRSVGKARVICHTTVRNLAFTPRSLPGSGWRVHHDFCRTYFSPDNQILDSDVPVRQMLEQIVAKTGLPPFMLGLSWSSTERMSTQQADVLTSEIDAYRRILTPVIERICRTYLLFEGTPSQVTAEWDDVTLQDNVELARAELYAAQAEKIRKEIENGE